MANKLARKWQDQFIYRAYQLAREGYSDRDIARTLNVQHDTLVKWLTTKPAFCEALAEGRAAKLDSHSHLEEVYSRLPEELQDVWDRIEAVEPMPRDDGEIARDKRRHRRLIDTEIDKMEARYKQQLYLYALLSCNFNNSEACRKVNISITLVHKWMKDKWFAQLRQGIHEAKKDLFESCLVGLVKQGDPSATIFANKTINRDRGYSDKITVELKEVPGKTLEQLNLTLEERLLLLERLRQSETKTLPQPAEDAEFEVTDG